MTTIRSVGLSVALLCAVTAADPAAAQSEVSERFSRTVHLDPRGTFELANITGDVVITAGSGRDVVIEAVKRVRRPGRRAAQALLRAIDIQVLEEAARIEVRTMYPRPRNFPGSVDFAISVPDDASVTIRTLSGNVRATNIKGELRAETVTGNIVAVTPQRVAALKCVSGDIEVTDAVADDLITASTLSGRISIRGLRARAARISSVSGDIRVENAQAERLDVRTVNGAVTYSGDLARRGRYRLTSHSGDIRLTLSGAVGFDLQASTFSGTVTSDFESALRPARGAGRPARERAGRVLRGAFGDASAVVTLRAFSGSISVVRR